MRRANENTLIHLIKAMDAQRAVTIRYVKSTGQVSRRKIEIKYIEVSNDGNILIQCYDHRSGDQLHTFRLDRITHYTLHRTAKTATYVNPVVPAVRDLTDADGEVIGFRAWDDMFSLVA